MRMFGNGDAGSAQFKRVCEIHGQFKFWRGVNRNCGKINRVIFNRVDHLIHVLKFRN